MPQNVHLSDTIARLFSRWPALALVIVASVAGCGEPAQIRSYEVPKSPSAAAPGVQAERVPKRIVAATLLGETRAWFFKVEGPPEAIEEKREEIDSFFQSIVHPTDAAASPTWELPADWQELPGNEMRMATLKVPTERDALDLTIIPLDKSAEDEKRYLLDNVNRWRGQIGLDPIRAEGLDGELEVLDIEGGKLWVFDRTGEGSAGGAMPPMMAGHPPIGASEPTPRDAADKDKAKADPAAEPITYELPEGWTDVGSRMMVRRVVKVETPAGEAELTISDYPVHGQMGDLLSNVNRWCGQVGLPSIAEQDLKKFSDEVTVSDKQGTFITLFNPDTGDEGEAIVGAMVQTGNVVWFLKLKGPRKVVEPQRDVFTEWLKTVRIAEGNS